MRIGGLEKVVNTLRDFVGKLADLIAMSLFVIFLFIGLYAFYDAGHVSSSGVIGEDVKMAVSDDGFSMEELKRVNSDIIGWVKIDGTHIDHPILQGPDNNKYLVRDYTGEFATAGSVFADYRNNKLADDFTIIYAHRMKDGLMFSDVTNYSDRDYFNSHLTGELYSEEGEFKLEVLGFAVLNVANTNIYELDWLKSDAQAAYESLKKNFLYEGTAAFNSEDRLLLLSTCDKDARYKRDVLLTRLVAE